MYLEKLEIQGFKSFANHTTLLFNRDMTAIVGPNGSGKSNIADAVRWVLGEQSVKTLRGKKSEDVIFAGSDKKNKLGYAEVSLYLNNSDRQADVDYEQIIVTRKIERNGETEYLINNNKVRLFDVQLLLAKANFGQKTYSVIGQGMIDSILVSSGQERKEFFDEATGVKQFQIKKNQAINKLDSAKENLEQTAKILAELDPRLRSLTRQVKRLEKREKLEEELRSIQTEYYSFLTNNINKDLKEKRDDFDKLQKEVSDLNQKLIDLQTQLDKEERSSSRQDNFTILQKKLSQIQSELAALIKEKTILEGQADLKLMSTGKSDIVWLKSRIEEVKNQINQDKLTLAEKESALKLAKSNVDELEHKRKFIMEEFSKLEDKLMNNGEMSPEELRDKLAGILKKQIGFQELLEKMESIDTLPDLKKACYQVTESVNTLFSKIKVSKEDNRKLWQSEFNKMLNSKDNLVAEISEARTKLAVLESELNKIKENVDRSEDELKKLESDAKRLSGDRSDNSDILKNILTRIEGKNKDLQDIEKQIQEFNQIEESKKQSLVQAQKVFREVQADFNNKNSRLNEIKVQLARLETRQEELEREIMEELKDFKLKKTGDINIEVSREKINSLKNQLSIIGGIDEIVMEEYKEVSERYNFLKSQSDDLNVAIAHLEKVIKDLEEAISKQFDQSFRNINKYFNEYFKKLFSGGKAELILDISEVRVAKKGNNEDEDSDDNDEEDEVETKKQYGIEIKATPPGKKLSSINMLSGGEKALTSIALISAIIANSPSPFVVLDEVDAALDEANSVRFAEILKELSEKTQFVAITHNRATMHKSKIIYGVTMGDDGVSKLLSMSFDEADQIAA